ncbi:MAG TPA: hypothetical protein VM536_14080 [Chloroflexia bacterium]|nr:hypothetical protein [Chloroflexia bacterium]
MRRTASMRGSWCGALLVGAALLGGAMLTPAAVAAPPRHPAPSVLHDYLIALTPRSLTVHAFLRISPELVPAIYRQIDQDGDGKTSDGERTAWFQSHATRLQIRLDGVPQALQISPAPALSVTDLLMSSHHPVALTYSAALVPPLEGSKHRILLTYGDNYVDYDEYYVSTTGDPTSDGQPRGVAMAHYPATYQMVFHLPDATNPADGAPAQLAPAPWTAGTPAAARGVPAPRPIVAAPGTNAPTSPAAGASAPIVEGLRNWHGEMPAALGMLLLALALGALHALSPGHGKTMVAAYLVGTRGRVRDAVWLGGVVTLTHTFGVILLGLGLLGLTAGSFPPALHRVLGLVAGVVVLVLGVFLLVQRWRLFRTAPRPTLPVYTTVPVRVVGSGAVRAAAGAGSAHGPAHAPARAAGGAPSHQHPHDHRVGPGHGAPGLAAAGSPAGVRAIIGLGVAGGLVPCPDAIAIILLAAAVGQVGLGLGLVTAFSAGLAAVLIALGVLLVTMQGVLVRSPIARMAHNPWWTRGLPIVSAALVALIGIVMIGAALPALPR